MDGDEFPLYDLPSILKDETSSGDPIGQKVIMVEAHEHPIALGVDRVERVVSVNSDRIHPLPLIFKGLPLSCFPQVLKHEDELILLFNPEEIENLEPEIPDTETYMPKLEAVKSSLEAKENPGPMAQTALDINEILQDSSQKSEVGNEEPASGITYSESTPSDEIKSKQLDLNDHPSETIGIDPDFGEGTTSRFVKEAMIALEELPKIEPFKLEESILSGEQEQFEPEPSAIDATLENMTPDTEDSDPHDTEEMTAVADVDQTAPEISKESFQPEESIISDQQEQAGSELLTMNASLEDMTPDTEHSDVHDTEEKTAVADVEETASEISLDKDEVETSVEGGHLEAAGLDHSNSANEDKDMPFLPVGDVPYLFAAVSTESEPISIKPAEIVSLRETEAALETPEPESTDPFRSAKEDKVMPLLPVREVPYPLSPVSTESEPISIGPDDFILSDSSDTIKSAYENQSEKVLTPPGLTRELEIDHGKRKASYRSPVAAGVLAMVALLLLSIWLWPKSTPKVQEVIRKPMPIYAVREVREKSEELLQAPQRFETEDQGFSQTPEPLNTGEKATVTVDTSLKADTEVFKIETNEFTLTVERPKATDKNGWLPASVGKTGENEHSHIVMKNDTLWEIAKRYLDDPFRYPELAERSRISNPDRIYPGDVVRIINKNKQRKGKERKSSQERSNDGNR